MSTNSAPRTFPFLEAGVQQRYSLHQLCGWGIVSHQDHVSPCKCARLIQIIATFSEEIDPVTYWIIEPVASGDDVFAVNQWLAEERVIVGGLVWNEALAQC